MQTEDFQTEDFKDIPGSNFAVFRIKRDLFDRSYIGAMFTNKKPGEKGNYNRTYGLDAHFVFFRNLSLQGFVAGTQTPGFHG